MKIKMLKVAIIGSNPFLNDSFSNQGKSGARRIVAFKEGAPHDNRCLSWYDSYQPEAYRQNGWFKTNDGVDLPEDEINKKLDMIREEREKKIGKVFSLSSFTCGFEEDEKKQILIIESEKAWNKFHKDENGNPEPFIPEDHICKVGCPAKACEWCKGRWTYENPVKCACWFLGDGKTMDEYIKDYKISMPATELAELLFWAMPNTELSAELL